MPYDIRHWLLKYWLSILDNILYSGLDFFKKYSIVDIMNENILQVLMYKKHLEEKLQGYALFKICPLMCMTKIQKYLISYLFRNNMRIFYFI